MFLLYRKLLVSGHVCKAKKDLYARSVCRCAATSDGDAKCAQSAISCSAALGFVPSIPLTPAAADTIYGFLRDSGTLPDEYDLIVTGDLGRVGSRLLRDLLSEKGMDPGELHSDCGVMIFSREQDVHAGGSGCGCCASVLCGHILNAMREGRYRNILFVPTGALLSPTTVMQKQTIPSVAHLVNIRADGR